MRHTLYTLGFGLLALQPACMHGGHGPEAGARPGEESCGCGCGHEHHHGGHEHDDGPADEHRGCAAHDGGPAGEHRGCAAHDGRPGHDHEGPPPHGGAPFDANVTLGLHEIMPFVHGHPHGAPPSPDAARPKAIARSFDFNETVSLTEASGQVQARGVSGSVSVHDVGGAPSLDGNVVLTGDAAGAGLRATLQLSGLTGDGPGRCFWPTAGTVVRTNADGSVHRLVFGPNCQSATLDGKAVTLPGFDRPPFGGPHHEPEHDAGQPKH